MFFSLPPPFCLSPMCGNKSKVYAEETKKVHKVETPIGFWLRAKLRFHHFMFKNYAYPQGLRVCVGRFFFIESVKFRRGLVLGRGGMYFGCYIKWQDLPFKTRPQAMFLCLRLMVFTAQLWQTDIFHLISVRDEDDKCWWLKSCTYHEDVHIHLICCTLFLPSTWLTVLMAANFATGTVNGLING